jgi:hypothetical protein
MLTIDSSDPPGRKIATFYRDCDWSEFFPDAIEDIPIKSPDPFGDPLKLTVYVDADHARNNVTHRSITGILLLINNVHHLFGYQNDNELWKHLHLDRK